MPEEPRVKKLASVGGIASLVCAGDRLFLASERLEPNWAEDLTCLGSLNKEIYLERKNPLIAHGQPTDEYQA
jgi:hypothetical protein